MTFTDKVVEIHESSQGGIEGSEVERSLNEFGRTDGVGRRHGLSLSPRRAVSGRVDWAEAWCRAPAPVTSRAR